MDRREFLRDSATSIAGAASISTLPTMAGPLAARQSPRRTTEGARVAFVLSEGANVIDLAGAWEVFQDAMVSDAGGHRHPFELYTVAESAHAVRATGGLELLPHHTLADAPPPDIVSVGAQRGSTEIHRWILEQSARTDVLVMSVCTGAFQLAKAGVLDGRRATTHHDFWDRFEAEFPEVELIRGRRWVEDGLVVTAGGLTSGIDAALHVVARTVGSEVAARTADYMEYRSDEWRNGVAGSP